MAAARCNFESVKEGEAMTDTRKFSPPGAGVDRDNPGNARVFVVATAGVRIFTTMAMAQAVVWYTAAWIAITLVRLNESKVWWAFATKRSRPAR
jgi:hypothetical protein